MSATSVVATMPAPIVRGIRLANRHGTGSQAWTNAEYATQIRGTTARWIAPDCGEGVAHPIAVAYVVATTRV